MTQGKPDRSRTVHREKRPPKPLDAASLRDLALFYASRFASTEARLATYLTRKLRERGWSGDAPPDIAALTGRLAELRYVDDRAWGEAKARTMAARGLGARRVREALRHGGVGDDDMAAVLDRPDGDDAAEPGLAEAIIFARRKRIGPFGANPATRDPDLRRRALAAMLRAGHGFDIARRILDAPDAETLESQLTAG